MAQNIKSLSKSETKLLAILSAEGKNIFSFDDAKRVLTGDRTRVKQALYILAEKGWIKNLERGKYLVVPFEGIAQGTWSEEAFVVASTLVDPYAIAYWSALNHYGYTEQISRTIFVQTIKRKFRAETEILGIPYKFVTLKPYKFFGTTIAWFGNKKVVITDKEKTIADCLDHPEYCGGTVEAAKGLANAVDDRIDLKKLTQYARKMDNRAIFKRLGYLSEMLELPVKDYSSQWQRMVSPGYAILDPLSTRTGKYNSRWHIQVNVSKTNLTEWRTH